MKQTPQLSQRAAFRYLLQGLALAGVATVGVFIFTVQPETWEQLKGFNIAYIPLLFALSCIAWLCNGARYRIVARALGYTLRFKQALMISLSTEFGMAATPAGMGGTVIRLSMLRRAGVPVAAGGTMMTTDAAIDIAFFLLLAPIAVFVILREQAFLGLVDEASDFHALGAMGLLLLLLVCLVALLRAAWFHRRLHRAAAATRFGRRRRLPGRWRHLRWRTSRSIRHILEALRFLGRRRKSALASAFALAAVQWSCRYGLLPLILLAFGIERNPLPLFLIQGLLFAFSLLLVLPGGGGGVEVTAALILRQLVPIPLVAVILLMWRFFTFHLYLLVGGSVFFYTCRHMDRLFPREASQRAEPLIEKIRGS
jgi:glycosyltransferase 2 family protein